MIILCLHGWGGSSDSFADLRESLKESDIKILSPDLPGFGDEPEPKEPWTVDNYADWVADYINKKIDGPYMLLAHSHGGRIAIKLCTSRLPTPYSPLPNHLFLCASAGIRHPKHIKRIVGLTIAKTGKFFLSIPGLRLLQPLGKKFLYKLVRVHDYEKASDLMKKTLQKVTAEDLRPLLNKIDTPTDLFWGTEDTMTPYKDALIMEREINGSTLHTFKGVRHKVQKERPDEIAEVIRKLVV